MVAFIQWLTEYIVVVVLFLFFLTLLLLAYYSLLHGHR